MRIFHSSALRARQPYRYFPYHYRYLQTLPTSLRRSRGSPKLCLSPYALHDQPTTPPPSNGLGVSATRTHPFTLPTGLKYEFRTGSSFFAKRPGRPFPSPFNSAPSPPPSISFRDAFCNFHSRLQQSLNRNGGAGRPGESLALPLVATQEDTHGFLRGTTNGDDAIVSSPCYIGVADGVGAWNTRPQGHAALWSRLILHFWALETEHQIIRFNNPSRTSAGILTPQTSIVALQASYETTTALTKPAPFFGTTTACLALLLPPTTLLLTNVGDSQAFLFRPSEGRFIARTEEQWHWFDCPRQLGTNSPDTPEGVAKVVQVPVQEGDLVLIATDGLMDNLWEAEISRELMKWIDEGEGEGYMAEELVEKAQNVAMDPWGLSPYMERAVEQGLGIEGGKWDDISVVVARCQKRSGV